MSYYLSAGYDDNSSSLDAIYRRFTVRTQSVYKPLRGLQLTVGANYADSRTGSGKPGYGDVYSVQGNALYPYAQFADEKGAALPLTRDYRSTFIDTAGGGRLLDWKYYPLTDYQQATSRLETTDLLATLGVSYTLLKGLDLSLQYNYEKEAQEEKDLYDGQSYFARNLTNLYTQIDGAGNITYPVPVGGIRDLTDGSTEVRNFRAQASFNRQWQRSRVSVLGGWETRQAQSSSNRFRVYGYDDNVLTYTSVDYANFYTMYNSGYINTIPDNLSFSGTLNRFVSGYANGAYTYNSRYTVSGSVRKDASNLFGVESNRKGVPLYSIGAAWEASKEAFYHLRWLPFLKVRTTWGFSGNVDPGRSAVTTMGYIPDNYITHLTYGNISQIANPQLTWEKTKIVNTGIDFSARGGWFSGSLDYYLKDGSDLFGPSPVDVTTGLQRPTITKNIASMRGHGLDIDWQFKPLRKKVQWNLNFLFNYNLSRVKDYYVYADVGDNYVGSPSITPIPGKAVYSLLSYRWGGLSSSTGDPQGFVAGKKSTDYTAITGDSTRIADLVYSGPSVPPLFGSLMNSVSFQGFTLTVNIAYKLGYFFRKPSINYSSLFYGWNGNADYARRWQKPGDEAYTDVPSFSYPPNNLRDRVYQYSEALVRKGDNIRLQFVNLDYTLTRKRWKNLPFDNLRLYVYGANLGILWKRNREGLDPDYRNSLPPPKNITIGLSAGL